MSKQMCQIVNIRISYQFTLPLGKKLSGEEMKPVLYYTENKKKLVSLVNSMNVNIFSYIDLQLPPPPPKKIKYG